MASPACHSNLTAVQWTQEQDDLLKELSVLSDIRPNNKLKVSDGKIAIEDRYLESLRRAFSGDGCAQTAYATDRILLKGFAFAFKAHQYMGSKATLQTTFELSHEDFKLHVKCKEMKQILHGALWGLNHLSELYGSPKESETAIAQEFNDRITIFSACPIFDDKDREQLPKPKPIESNGSSTPSKFFINNTKQITDITYICFTCLSTAVAVVQLGWEIISFTSKVQTSANVMKSVASVINTNVLNK